MTDFVSSKKTGLQKNMTAVRRTVALNRALSKLGVASRAQAELLIASGRVRVNGDCVKNPERRVNLQLDGIFLDNVLLRPRTKVYLALHKPRGVVTSRQDEKNRQTVYAFLGEWDAAEHWLAPVGRLDKASSGLLLFSNDGVWADAITRSGTHVAKTYHVQIDRHFGALELTQMRRGMRLEDGCLTRPAEVRILRQGEKTQWLEIVLHQGLNRQIRRMVACLGGEVRTLVRVAIGPIALGALKSGEYRLLSAGEVAALGEAQ